MQTKTIEVFTLSELTGEAKENALSKLRDWATDADWYDAVYDDAKNIAALMGIEIDNIYFSGFCSQGDGACFDGRYKYVKGASKAVKRYAPLDKTLHVLCKRLQDVQRHYFYEITASISCNDRYHRTSGTYDINGRFCDIPDCVIDDMDQVFSELADWIYKELESEYDHLTSEETLLENSDANGYQFTDDGDLI